MKVTFLDTHDSTFCHSKYMKRFVLLKFWNIRHKTLSMELIDTKVSPIVSSMKPMLTRQAIRMMQMQPTLVQPVAKPKE